MSWLWIVPVLGILVIIHELGHFVTARMLGIRVEEFGIGFPPRLFAVRHNNIDYSLNWLPIGGFVRILGENGDSDAPDSFGRAAAWKRIIVLAAGSFMNLVMALLLFIGLGLFGEPMPDSTQVGFTSVIQNSPASAAHLQPGDLLLTVDGTPVSDTEGARDLLNNNRGRQVELTIGRNGQQMQVPVTLRQGPEPALGVSLDVAVSPIRVVDVQPETPAAAAGLQTGDIIKTVHGQDASGTLTFAQAMDQVKNGTTTITVERNGTLVPLTAALADGVLKGWSYRLPTHTVTYPPLESIGRGFARTGDLLRRIPEGLATVVAGLFSGQSEAGVLSGPVGIAQLTGEVATEQGISGLVTLTALLGINLFLINLLPLPALDGGRLLFILIELLRGGRKIAPEKEGMVHLIGMGLLLLLMVVITFFDVQHLLEGGSILHPR